MKKDDPKFLDNEILSLITASKQGDASAFNKLVARYLNDIYNFCYKITLNEADAKDLCQETFLCAFKK